MKTDVAKANPPSFSEVVSIASRMYAINKSYDTNSSNTNSVLQAQMTMLQSQMSAMLNMCQSKYDHPPPRLQPLYRVPQTITHITPIQIKACTQNYSDSSLKSNSLRAVNMPLASARHPLNGVIFTTPRLTILQIAGHAPTPGVQTTRNVHGATKLTTPLNNVMPSKR